MRCYIRSLSVYQYYYDIVTIVIMYYFIRRFRRNDAEDEVGKRI
jgi:hypothetical protein